MLGCAGAATDVRVAQTAVMFDSELWRVRQIQERAALVDEHARQPIDAEVRSVE